MIFEEIFTKEYELKIYPNPTNAVAYLQFNLEKNSTIDLNLVDNNGSKIELIFSGQISAGKNQFTISTNNLASGVYYLEVIVNGKNLRYKLLVQK